MDVQLGRLPLRRDRKLVKNDLDALKGYFAEHI